LVHILGAVSLWYTQGGYLHSKCGMAVDAHFLE